ncbi:hypothetical protein H4S06_001174 [Coemansia sp. BCRC 34490]|nr:hypothetical protein H4S06_001174 [Coemansia sp. BCRC 34490]
MADTNSIAAAAAGLAASGTPLALTSQSPLPQQPQLFHAEPIDVAEAWQQELVDCHTRLKATISGKPQQQAHDVLQQRASESMQHHGELVNGLVYGILTEPDSGAMYFQYLNIVSRDRFSHALSRLQLLAMAPKFARIRTEVRAQLLWIMEEMVRMDVPGTEQIAMTLTRQMRGGDISAGNVQLCRQMLGFLQTNHDWLVRHPMLVALAAYSFGRLVLDHSSPRLAELQQRESDFVVRLVRSRFVECAAVGRDLVRMLQDVAKIPAFRELWHDMLHRPRAVSAHFGGIEQLLRTPTPRVFLANRLTFEMETRLLFILERLPGNAYSRNLTWFVHRYLSTPESETLYSDLIRYIVGVFHPPNAVLASNIVPRYVFLGILLRYVRSQVVAANAKLALFFDWLFYDPATDNIMNIEPGVLIIARSTDKYAYLTASFLEFLNYLADAYLPPMAAEIRASIAGAMNDAVEKGVVPSLLPVFEHPRIDMAARRHMYQLFPRLVPPVPAAAAMSSASRQQDAEPSDSLALGSSGDGDPVSRMFDDGDDAGEPQLPEAVAATVVPRVSLISAEMNQQERTNVLSIPKAEEGSAATDAAGEDDLPLVVDNGDGDADADSHPITNMQEALDDPSLWIFGSTLRDFAAGILDEAPASASKDQIKEIINMYAQSEASSRAVAYILSLAIADAELEDIETEAADDSDGASEDHDILYYIFDTACPFFAANGSPALLSSMPAAAAAAAAVSTAESSPSRRRIAELLVRLTETRVDVGFRWLLFSLAGLSSSTSQSLAYRQYVGAYSQGGSMRSALARDMGVLQERFPEHFYAVLPAVYSAFPAEFVGSCAIIKSVVALIDQPQVYRLCVLIAQGRLRLFCSAGCNEAGGGGGGSLGALTMAVGRAMDGDDAFEQVCLWQLLEAEIAGNAAATGRLAAFILLERDLDPASCSEAANGLLSLLRSTPPTTEILSTLVKYSAGNSSTVLDERVDFCGSAVVAWGTVFRQQLLDCAGSARFGTEEERGFGLLADRLESRFGSNGSNIHAVVREMRSQRQSGSRRKQSGANDNGSAAATIAATPATTTSSTVGNGVRRSLRKNSVSNAARNGRDSESEDSEHSDSEVDSASNSDGESESESSVESSRKRPRRSKRTQQKQQRQPNTRQRQRQRQQPQRKRRIAVIASEDDESSASESAASATTAEHSSSDGSD